MLFQKLNSIVICKFDNSSTKYKQKKQLDRSSQKTYNQQETRRKAFKLSSSVQDFILLVTFGIFIILESKAKSADIQAIILFYGEL